MTRILKQFCEVPRFIQVNAGRPCRLKCGKCQKKWGSGFVNRMETARIENGKMETKILYICETCTSEIESGETLTAESQC